MMQPALVKPPPKPTIAGLPVRTAASPILKWAGGKSQLLRHLLPHVPDRYGRYMEPFLGGGALFFYLAPDNALIADSNPELINLYRTVSSDVEALIARLADMPTDEENFYRIRLQRHDSLDPVAAAARTVYLNKTCFNGLYRVNRSGHFNVPYGSYVNPRICEPDKLRTAARVLRKAEIIESDYESLLLGRASAGDFVYLDPPYLPISKFADFKRYTKRQFYEEDHRRLAKLARELRDRGCQVLMTNSVHPLIWELYRDFKIDVVNTRRNISKNGDGRFGQDVVIYSK